MRFEFNESATKENPVTRLICTLCSIALLGIAGCKDKPSTAPATVPAMGHDDHAGHDLEKAPAGKLLSGTVLQKLEAGRYTYIELDIGTEKIWAAAPQVTAKVGDKASVYTDMPMPNFKSEKLDRTFEMLYFAAQIGTPASQATAGMPAGHPSIANNDKAVPQDFSGITKPKGGKTVAEIMKDIKALNGKKVTLRGKVVKVSTGIMNRNWVHIKDGTGEKGSDDLTVTTLDSVSVGDTVLVKGLVSADKDFGYGYRYAVIIESASVAAEK